MEDVLDLYARPDDSKHPQVCFDERPCQLVQDLQVPLAAAPGRLQRYDYEYERQGNCNLFAFFEPLAGWRHLKVTQRRTNQDFAQCMKDLVDVHFPDADQIRVVLDNLSTHTPAALYQTFEPHEALRILQKLEFHYTPKHGSWLNMVEIELSVLSRQCLRQRIPKIETMQREVEAWQQHRNARRATVNWQFTAANPRSKLKRLYPALMA